MKKWMFLMPILVLFLASCSEIRDVEFQGMENFQVKKSGNEKITIMMDAKLYNPNSFNIKIKPSTIDIFVGTNNLGKAKIVNVTKLKKLEKGNYPIEIETSIGEVLGGGLGGLLGAFTKQKIDLRMKGDLRVGAFGLSTTVPVDHTESIDLSGLKGML